MNCIHLLILTVGNVFSTLSTGTFLDKSVAIKDI
jgi:hypothetical protein